MKSLRIFLLMAFITFQTVPVFAAGMNSHLDAPQALAELKSGNGRFVSSKMKHPRQDMTQVRETAKGQNPFAVVITCSDSRVSPEVIFDQGLGDLFVIRVAGNVLGDAEIGSVEYAVAHLHTPLVVVLGHTKCGAVAAVVENDELTPSLKKSLKGISVAKKAAMKQGGDILAVTTEINICQGVEILKNKQPVLQGKVANGEVKILPAIYDVESGIVKFYNDCP